MLTLGEPASLQGQLIKTCVEVTVFCETESFSRCLQCGKKSPLSKKLESSQKEVAS